MSCAALEPGFVCGRHCSWQALFVAEPPRVRQVAAALSTEMTGARDAGCARAAGTRTAVPNP